jgi:hypothetical protein
MLHQRAVAPLLQDDLMPVLQNIVGAIAVDDDSLDLRAGNQARHSQK